MESCPVCKAKEIESNTPFTVYACGSKDYDQKEGSFIRSKVCVKNENRAYLKNMHHTSSISGGYNICSKE